MEFDILKFISIISSLSVIIMALVLWIILKDYRRFK